MARWSLRTKLLAATAIALLPVLALACWRTYDDVRAAKGRQADAVAAAAELAVSRHRELIEGSHRLLLAACANDAVRKSAEPTATAADIDECETYLAGLVKQFPAEYSAAIVTDAGGVARCASVRTVVGTSFADRDVFNLVRDTMGFSIGAYTASRATTQTVIPMAIPIVADGRFRGMCALGISLRAFSELVRSAGTNQATRRHPGRSARSDDRRQRRDGVVAAAPQALCGGHIGRRTRVHRLRAGWIVARIPCPAAGQRRDVCGRPRSP